MYKPMVFIGSSKEGIDVARVVKEQFDPEAEVVVWDETIFQLSKHNLESLLRTANLYDFGILIYTADDEVTSRGNIHQAPRDNVLFEHGLFTGRLGPSRTFFIFEEGVKLPSDLAGITAAEFRKPDDGNLKAALEKACNKVRWAMQTQMQRPEISLSPSMSLAISFFQHYLRPLAYELESNRGKEVIEASRKHRFTYDDFVIQVLVPEHLSQIMPDGSIRGEPSLVSVHISHPGRSYSFYVTKGAINVKRTPLLEVFAKPRVLEAIRDLVVFTSGLNPEQTLLEKREIRNFAKAIELLIEREYGPRTPHVKLCSIEAVSARQRSRTDRPRTSRRGR